jgi:hypothetical protein
LPELLRLLSRLPATLLDTLLLVMASNAADTQECDREVAIATASAVSDMLESERISRSLLEGLYRASPAKEAEMEDAAPWLVVPLPSLLSKLKAGGRSSESQQESCQIKVLGDMFRIAISDARSDSKDAAEEERLRQSCEALRLKTSED